MTKPRRKPGPPSRGGKTPLVSFRLSPDLVARLDQRARTEGTDRTAVLRSACEKYLAIPAGNDQSGKNTGIV